MDTAKWILQKADHFPKKGRPLPSMMTSGTPSWNTNQFRTPLGSLYFMYAMYA